MAVCENSVIVIGWHHQGNVIRVFNIEISCSNTEEIRLIDNEH